MASNKRGSSLLAMLSLLKGDQLSGLFEIGRCASNCAKQPNGLAWVSLRGHKHRHKRLDIRACQGAEAAIAATVVGWADRPAPSLGNRSQAGHTCSHQHASITTSFAFQTHGKLGQGGAAVLQDR